MTSRFAGFSLPRLGTALVAILVLVAQLFAAISGADGSSSVVPGIVSFVMYTLVAGWAIMARGQRLPIAPTVAAVIVPSVAAVVCNATIVTFDRDALWHLGAAAFLLLLVALRGRLLAAWIGMAGVATTTPETALSSGTSPRVWAVRRPGYCPRKRSRTASSRSQTVHRAPSSWKLRTRFLPQ